MITKVEDKNRIKKIFHKIFDSYDPFDPLNENHFPVRAVIYPTNGYFLSELQFQALSKTLKALEESKIIISEVETSPYDPFTRDRHWVLSDFEYQEYDSLPLAIENAIFSESGKWGFLLSHEDHAVLVCDNKFSQIYQADYQPFKNDLTEFIKYWDEVKFQGTETDWVPRFLNSLTVV